MRRDYFELNVEHVAWVDSGGEPEKPTVYIDFHGPDGMLRDRLTDVDGELLEAKETDVTFRLHDEMADPESTGVVAVTNRLTGDFILELNEEVGDVFTFIQAAREYGQATNDPDGRYRVHINIDGERVVTYEKETFLVYDADGGLLRGQSLIPSGVEL